MKFFRFLFLVFFLSAPTYVFADPNPAPAPNNNPPPTNETPEQKLAAALRREDELKAEIEKLKKGTPPTTPPPPDDDDLRRKVQKDKESAEELSRQTKFIEQALGFNMSIDQFVKTNKDLLPSEIGAIVAQANKETYDSAQAKAAAVKSAIIQSYFAVQSNIDSLTNSQKVTLDDYLKLTKTGKENKAAEIYENIFEPSLETTRKVKKAEEVSRARSGFATVSEAAQSYRDRLVKSSRKTHLGEKEA